MTSQALSIITNAEYLAIYKNGRNSHEVDGLLTRIYLLCSVEEYHKATTLIDVLDKVVHKGDAYQRETYHQFAEREN